MSPTDSKSDTVAVYKRLLSTSFQYWPVFVVASLSMAVYAACDTGFAFLVKLLTGVVVESSASDPTQEFIARWLPLGVIILFVVRGATGFLSSYAMSWIARQSIKSLRGQLFDKYLHLPHEILRSQHDRRSAVAPDLQHRADRRGSVQHYTRAHPRQPDHHRVADIYRVSGSNVIALHFWLFRKICG